MHPLGLIEVDQVGSSFARSGDVGQRRLCPGLLHCPGTPPGWKPLGAFRALPRGGLCFHWLRWLCGKLQRRLWNATATAATATGAAGSVRPARSWGLPLSAVLRLEVKTVDQFIGGNEPLCTSGCKWWVRGCPRLHQLRTK